MTTTKERPIPFTGEMIRAILARQKTQTRRAIKPQPVLGEHWKHGWIVDGEAVDIPVAYSPYGIPGDRLWAKETWRIAGLMYDDAPMIQYRADGIERECDPIDGPGAWDDDKYLKWCHRQWGYMDIDCPKAGIEADTEGIFSWTTETNPNRWHPSMFIPRWACRIMLEVTGVRVERLQEISEGDAVAEGWPRHLELFHTINAESKALNWFSRLWDTINQPRGFGWETNPRVWVVEFEVLEP